MSTQRDAELMTEAQKMARLKSILAKLQLPVEMVKVSPIYRVDRYSLLVLGDAATYIDQKEGDLDRLLALSLGKIFKAIYKRARRFARDRRSLANWAYYYIIGELGHRIKAEDPEETRRPPKWLKGFGYPDNAPFPYDGSHDGFWVDHVFWSRDGCYVSEPYRMDISDFENLVKFCRANSLTFRVEGESRHFPGHTFRVTIMPEKEAKPNG